MSELDLRRLFVNIRRESRSSVSVDDLTSDFHGCCIKAAVAKCIDFNITINRKRKTSEEAFVLLAGLRSICEDLIVLRYLATVSKPLRQGYLIAMLDLNREQSIAAQHAFFKANNPLQPVIGAGLTDDQIDARVAQYANASAPLHPDWEVLGGTVPQYSIWPNRSVYVARTVSCTF
jgi:hypothetical protein